MTMEDQENIWITAAIGSNIRKARMNCGLSQEALALRVNASHRQIAAYEQGEKDMPVSRLFDIAQIIGVTVADLLKDAL
jgi:transcriptional regulator with XRE-family HTH domain